MKIFDSWSGVLDAEGFRRFAIEPVREIVARVRAAVPGAPIIAFPKGAGARLEGYATETMVDCLAVDWTVPIATARKLVGPKVPLQGNLDPLRLVAGGSALTEDVDADSCGDARTAPYLQSRPRHHAGYADRACRARLSRAFVGGRI